MASNKSKSNIPVGRQTSGIFPKKNPLASYGSLTSQPTKKSLSSNRLEKRKSVQLNPHVKSKTSLISKRFSTISNFSKNTKADIKTESQSALSILSEKKNPSTKIPTKKPTDDSKRKTLANHAKPELKSPRRSKEEKNDKDILEVYKEEGYAESEIHSLHEEEEEEFDEMKDCGDNVSGKKSDKYREQVDKFTITTGTGRKICEDLITYMSQIRLESPGDGGNFHEKCLSVFHDLENKINNELLKKKTEFDTYMLKTKGMNLTDFKNQTIMLEEIEKEKIQLQLCIEAYKVKLEETEKRLIQVQEIPKHIVQELQTTIEEQDKEIQRIININKCLEEHKKGVDMKNEVLLRELSQCEIRITKFKGENENLKENLFNMRTRTYQEIENDYKEMLENQNVQQEKMKKTISDNYKQIDDLKAELDQLKARNVINQDNQNAQLLQELELINVKCKELETRCEMLLTENKNIQDNKNEIDKAKRNYDETITKLKKERDEAINESDELRNALNEKEEILEGFDMAKSDDHIDRLRQEVQRLHSQNNSVLHENEELKKQALRMKVECRAAEETNIMNQRLLKIRGELIKYFHESKDKCSIHDIYPGLSKSNANNDSEIFMRDSKVSLNFNDLQKLSSTLDSKDTDIASKVHMIRYLEDNENRYKRTISKLRDYNARLESENADLKRLLRMDSQLS